jgi:ribose-phosphate pyrophosphokinase
VQLIIASKEDEGLCDYTYKVKRFPSGEIEISLFEDVSGIDVFIFHKVKIGEIHDSLFEVLLVAIKCRDLRAKSVSLIIPYLPYSRCDQTSLSGLYSILEAVGIKKIITADIHSYVMPTGIEIHSIPLASLIIKDLGINLKGKLIVSPDRGGYNRAKKVSEAFGCDFACLDKIRSANSVEHILDFDVVDREIIIVDDIIDSGKTVRSAAKALSTSGAKSIEVVVTHLVRLSNLNQVDYIYTTDTVRHTSLPEKFRVLELQRTIFSNILR